MSHGTGAEGLKDREFQVQDQPGLYSKVVSTKQIYRKRRERQGSKKGRKARGREKGREGGGREQK